MENPASWSRDTQLVSDVIEEYDEESFGLSLPMTITRALHDAGLLKYWYADDNVRRLLETFRKLHNRYDGCEDGDGYSLFICNHCNVPAPCPSQQIMDDMEEYVL